MNGIITQSIKQRMYKFSIHQSERKKGSERERERERERFIYYS